MPLTGGRDQNCNGYQRKIKKNKNCHGQCDVTPVGGRPGVWSVGDPRLKINEAESNKDGGPAPTNTDQERHFALKTISHGSRASTIQLTDSNFLGTCSKKVIFFL